MRQGSGQVCAGTEGSGPAVGDAVTAAQRRPSRSSQTQLRLAWQGPKGAADQREAPLSAVAQSEVREVCAKSCHCAQCSKNLSWPAEQMRPQGRAHVQRTAPGSQGCSTCRPGLLENGSVWSSPLRGGHCLPLRPPPVTPRRLFPCLPLTEWPPMRLLPSPGSRVNRHTQSLAHRPCGVWACSTGPGPGEGAPLPSRLWSPASWPPKLPWPRQPHSQLPGAKPMASQQAG